MLPTGLRNFQVYQGKNIYFHPHQFFKKQGGGGSQNVGSEGRQDGSYHIIFFDIFVDYRYVRSHIVHMKIEQLHVWISFSYLYVNKAYKKYLKQLWLKGGMGSSPIKVLVIFIQNGALLGKTNGYMYVSQKIWNRSHIVH